MSEEYDIEIDDSTYSLLDAITRSNNDPLKLAALAKIAPDDFRKFLMECNEVENRDAMQLLKAAEAIRSSNTTAATNAVVEPRKIYFLILSKDPQDGLAIGRAFTAIATDHLAIVSDNTEQFLSEIVRARPSAVIINLAQMGEEVFNLVQRITNDFPSIPVICASSTPSPSMILGTMRAGAREFLSLPISNQELTTIIERIAEFVREHAANEPGKRGRAIAVFSSKGSCGCSVIATNLALLQPDSTVLVDLNSQSGDLDLMLGLQPKYSLVDLIENRDRLEHVPLTSYLTQYSGNVTLLAAPLKAGSVADIEPRHIYEIIELLRHQFDSVIIDTPHSFDPVTVAALDYVDQIVVVLDYRIQAIRSTQKALEVFDRLGYPRTKIRLIVNRWPKHTDLSPKRIEQFFGERVVAFIPSNYQVVVDSINTGQPAVIWAPSSDFAGEIVRLARRLASDDYVEIKNTETSKDLTVQDLFKKANLFEDLLARFRPKEST